MFNLFDILQGQGGAGLPALGQQFGLSPDQSRKAMEALLPALTLGLQRNALTDPAAFGRMFGMVSGDGRATGPFLQPDALLGQLFGSPALSQAVLQQAASASGIGAHALRQMLPAMAGMVVAGIVHLMLNQNAATAPASRDVRPEPPAELPAVKFWNDWLGSFQASAQDDGPAGKSRTDRNAAREPEPRIPAPSPKDDGSLEVFQQMFQSGVQVQEQNAKAMQSIFESFWSSPPDDPATGADTASSEAQTRSPRETRKPRATTAGGGT